MDDVKKSITQTKMKTTVKEIKRILSESDKYAVIGQEEFSNQNAMVILDSYYDYTDELNILEFDKYFAIWR